MTGNKRIKRDADVANGRDRHKIVLAIDYGTTFTGVAWAPTYSKGIRNIHIIEEWPFQDGQYRKVPSQIAYACENGDLEENVWGFGIEHKHKSYSWTKLLLDRDADTTSYDDPSIAEHIGSGFMQLPQFRTAEAVCEDFLREVYDHIMAVLNQEMNEASMLVTKMEVWITLPAIWSDKAEAATLTAARNAGFGSREGDEIYTISEPEAAALAVIEELTVNDGQINALKPGEHILICDCGGGTVDLTTYTVIELKPKLEFEELLVGIGGKCGSTSIDRNFHDLMAKRFGHAFERLSAKDKGSASRFMRSFEKNKRAFGTAKRFGTREVSPIEMDVEDSRYYDQEEKAVLITSVDMEEIFKPLVDAIVEMIEGQIQDANVKKGAQIGRIILVGGLGKSAYLSGRLKDHFEMMHRLRVMSSKDPQAAIVQGAVLRGLNDLAPKTKQARRHYGVGVGMPFRAGVDNEKDSYICNIYNAKYCRYRVDWAIAKGEPIFKETSRKFNYVQEYNRGQDFEVRLDLWSSVDDTPPDQHISPGVKMVGSIVSTLSAHFNFGNALKFKQNSRKRKAVAYITLEVQVIFGTKGDNLRFQLLVNGRVSGTSQIEFTS